MLFLAEHLDSFKRENPLLSHKEATREISRVWKEETADEVKAQFAERARQDRERYEREMLVWNSRAPEPEQSPESDEETIDWIVYEDSDDEEH